MKLLTLQTIALALFGAMVLTGCRSSYPLVKSTSFGSDLGANVGALKVELRIEADTPALEGLIREAAYEEFRQVLAVPEAGPYSGTLDLWCTGVAHNTVTVGYGGGHHHPGMFGDDYFYDRDALGKVELLVIIKNAAGKRLWSGTFVDYADSTMDGARYGLRVLSQRLRTDLVVPPPPPPAGTPPPAAPTPAK